MTSIRNSEIKNASSMTIDIEAEEIKGNGGEAENSLPVSLPILPNVFSSEQEQAKAVIIDLVENVPTASEDKSKSLQIPNQYILPSSVVVQPPPPTKYLEDCLTADDMKMLSDMESSSMSDEDARWKEIKLELLKGYKDIGSFVASINETTVEKYYRIGKFFNAIEQKCKNASAYRKVVKNILQTNVIPDRIYHAKKIAKIKKLPCKYARYGKNRVLELDYIARIFLDETAKIANAPKSIEEMFSKFEVNSPIIDDDIDDHGGEKFRIYMDSVIGYWRLVIASINPDLINFTMCQHTASRLNKSIELKEAQKAKKYIDKKENIVRPKDALIEFFMSSETNATDKKEKIIVTPPILTKKLLRDKDVWLKLKSEDIAILQLEPEAMKDLKDILYHIMGALPQDSLIQATGRGY
ncbi:MAG: hypothetical protein WAX69_16900 [Victivallales bacterium]